MWGVRGIAVAALCGAALVAPAAAAQAGPHASLAAARSKLPAEALPTLEAHLAKSPPVARRLARLAAPHLTFRIARGPHDRAHGVPLLGGGMRFVIALRERTWQHSAVGRFFFLHEIGHIVDWAFVGPSLRERFNAAFRASTRWRATDVSDHEVFAEQFAFWSGARRTLRSGYDVPPLLSRQAFGRLMEEAGWADDSPLRVTR